MRKEITEKEIVTFIKYWEQAVGKLLNKKEALKQMDEIDELRKYEEEVSEHNYLMQQAEDAMWRQGVVGNIKNGAKPLMVF